ncbi:MAG TPA: RNA polymerase-associated protein RapA, partial [Planctomycetaceae bacterium]|nr:RNA polymerase-associated protein RapA [Planctomycetaceae bacterium]
MSDFIPGQRWISDAELDQCLGTVLKADARTVTVLFLATGETRTYARQTAPLSRVAFAPGDEVRSHEGWTLHVEEVREEDGLLSYVGRRDDASRVVLAENHLDPTIQ